MIYDSRLTSKRCFTATAPAVLLCFASLLGGCGGGGGSTPPPSAFAGNPVSTPTPNPTPTPSTGTSGDGKAVLVRLQPGASIDAVAHDYGITVEAAAAEDGLYRVRGGNDGTLSAQLAQDPRCVLAESDDGVRSPEGAQTVNGDPIHVPFDFVRPTEPRFGSIAVTFSGAGEASAPDPNADPDAPFRQINLVSAKAVTRGAGVIVAVLDTGIQADHPLLQSHLLPGYNAVAPGSAPDDIADGTRNEAFGHGTMVAGIIARVAPDAKILPVRVLNGDGSGSLFTVVRGLRWAVANHARVVNLSLGTTESSGILREAIGDARKAGVVVVSSAGNAGGDIRDYPASFSETVSVAAVDANDQKAAFSNFGSHVHLSAPGTAIISTYPNGAFAAWSGTSFASPFVAGAAALVASINPNLDSDKIADALQKNARRITGADKIGAGVLDVGAAITNGAK